MLSPGLFVTTLHVRSSGRPRSTSMTPNPVTSVPGSMPRMIIGVPNSDVPNFQLRDNLSPEFVLVQRKCQVHPLHAGFDCREMVTEVEPDGINDKGPLFDLELQMVL